jgi:ribosomal-protein-serine acetyltransferase
MDFFPLKQGLALRILNLNDAAEMFRVVDRNRDHLRPWMPWLDHTLSPADIAAFIETTVKQQDENKGFQTAILLNDKIVGCMGYHPIDRLNKRVSLGYWLSADCQGKGIMTEACRFYLDYAFDQFHLNKVEILCATGNHRSKAIPKRLGFTEEGVIRQAGNVNGVYHDHVVFGMLAREWMLKREAAGK